MINLKSEAKILAHDIDKPFDFALERRLIATLISGRALLLHRSIVRNSHIPSSCIQVFGIPIEKAEAFDLFYNDSYKTSVKSKYEMPTPMRTASDTPFVSVTTLDGSINFAYSDIATVRFNSNAGQFVENTGRYIYHGNKIGAYHNEATLISSPILMVRGVFENPLLVKDYSGHYRYSEENFPMPMDMATEIRQMILKGELRIVPATQEITINDDK